MAGMNWGWEPVACGCSSMPFVWPLEQRLANSAARTVRRRSAGAHSEAGGRRVQHCISLQTPALVRHPDRNGLKRRASAGVCRFDAGSMFQPDTKAAGMPAPIAGPACQDGRTCAGSLHLVRRSPTTGSETQGWAGRTPPRAMAPRRFQCTG
jgi:hypothetical protein